MYFRPLSVTPSAPALLYLFYMIFALSQFLSYPSFFPDFPCMLSSLRVVDHISGLVTHPSGPHTKTKACCTHAVSPVRCSLSPLRGIRHTGSLYLVFGPATRSLFTQGSYLAPSKERKVHLSCECVNVCRARRVGAPRERVLRG